MKIRVSNGRNVWIETEASLQTIREMSTFCKFYSENGDVSRKVADELSIIAYILSRAANNVRD